MANPNGRRRLPTGAPGCLNVGYTPAGAHPYMINPYASAFSTRPPTASAEWNWDWLHGEMAAQQQQSSFSSPAGSFLPFPSFPPVHAPYTSFVPSTYSVIPTAVPVPFGPVPYPAPYAPAFPATYPYALPATAVAGGMGASLIGPWVPATARRIGVGDRKTLLCLYYKWKGRCHDGDECRFAHGEEDQRIVPGKWGSGGGRPCDEFATTGWCRYGRNCKYAHGGV